MAEAGHNASQEQLVQFVERIENLLEERQGINDDIKDVKAEAKANGFIPSTIMDVIRVRALPPGKYKVQWKILSVDTHRTEGNWGFEVRP